MKVSEARAGDVVILDVAGRIDSATASSFDAVVTDRLAGGVRNLLLDLKAVDYVSSAGLRVFLKAAKAMKADNRKLLLSSVDENVLQVFEISGFTRIFSFSPSREEGIAAFG